MSRIIGSLTILALVGLPPLAGQEQNGEVTLQELQRIVTDQRQLLEQQGEALRIQQEALNELRRRVDELSVAQGSEAPGMSPEEIALRERLARVEEQLAAPPDTPEDVLRAGEFPGSFRIPGTNMATKLGGNVRLGIVDNLNPVGSDDRFVVGTIPVGGAGEAGEGRRVVLSAKRSRLNLDSRMDSSVGQFRAFVEGDFASGNNDNYRLRHAYGQYKRYLVGQTWSTFMDRRAEPEELDFEGLNGQINERQPQFRWTRELSGSRTLAVGVEDPAPEITGGQGVSVTPDLVLALGKGTERGHLRAGLLLRNLIGEPESEPGMRRSAFGWAATLSSALQLPAWDPRDNVKLQLNYGEGIGRYLNDLDSVGGQDAAFAPDGRLRPLPAFGGYISLQHWWKRNPFGLFRDLRSTLVYGLVDVRNLDFQEDDAYKRTRRITLNLIWSPIAAIDIGAEFLWGEKLVKGGERGRATQIQSVVTFRF